MSHIRGMGFVQDDESLVDEDLASVRAFYQRKFGLAAPSLPGLLSGTIRSATFRSNGSPPVTWTPGSPAAAATSDPAGGGIFDPLDLIQPAVDIELANGQSFTIAPRGEPAIDYRTVLVGAGLGVLGALGTAAALGYWLGKRRRRNAR